MVKAKLTTAFVLAVIAIILVLQNTEPVETKFLFLTLTMPRAALLAITMLIGIAVGILVSLALTGKLKKKANTNPPSAH